MKLCYPACFYQNKETGFYVVEVPDLPGCGSGGHTLAEAILMGIDAASGWILTEIEEGRPIPPPGTIESTEPEEEGGFVDVLLLDIEEYSKKYGRQPIDKTLKIPAYLSTFADEQKIDISKIAQEALSQLYQDHQVASG
jgi:predicted RNase H-like HicB family nuclease